MFTNGTDFSWSVACRWEYEFREIVSLAEFAYFLIDYKVDRPSVHTKD